MPDKAAVEILVYKPDSANLRSETEKGVVVNPRLEKRFNQFVSIGVYLDGSDLKYYFFEQSENAPRIYSGLDELRQDLPESLGNIFDNKPKLFIMGHGNGGYYGLGNCHGPSEHLYDDNFDKLLSDFKQALPEHTDKFFVTLEACNTDNQADAAANHQEKTFLERVSEKHPDIIFGGTGPWDAHDVQTGFRSLAPDVPITSMGGNIWKAGNSVIFYHGEYQIAVKKSLFASTETAKNLKINTVEYARFMLRGVASAELIEQIALRRDILNIQDLKKVDGFPALRFEGGGSAFFEQEKQILEEEQGNYLTRVRGILARAAHVEQLTDRDVLELTLGLKEPAIFDSHERLLQTILENKALLGLLMVSCGKVLIGGPSNDDVIDFLLKNSVDINSVDEKGMTALHYAAQNFYNYRKEPLNLIKKLLDSGASLEVKDNQGRTPIDIARAHSQDQRVAGSDALLVSLQHGGSLPTPLDVKQSVRKIFQMSFHKADEQLSLPAVKREYVSCAEGTLYMPEDAGAKLGELLQSLKGNEALLSEFESELSLVTTELVEGKNTGQMLNDETDEIAPKCFQDAAEKLISVMDMLDTMKQEVASSAHVKEPVAAIKSSK
jgi:hypothetical protein